MSIGKDRVRLFERKTQEKDFDILHQIKSRTADLIDICEVLKEREPRLASTAQTAYEQACMWAVKLVTKG